MGTHFWIFIFFVCASAEECPVGFIEISGKCYLFSEHLGENVRTQLEARLFCQVLGHEYSVDLATLGSEATSATDPLMKYIYDNDMSDSGLWLGAERSGSTFQWIDGRDLSTESFLWHYAAPSSHDCVAVASSWNNNNVKRHYIADRTCSELYHFVCEKFQ
ncbi:unnamed protein product [Meganyctiphanes norvegica]|uniref:C-type lectin domain-containing protein n=1 Tax=Meganyctiphanes norvegica TaxID=48144 RepID=A0AAV2QZU6_MEGNR